jgi:SAM-dependent methyltransferase
MIKYARTQAETQQVNERVEFHVMDALQTLDFPADSFDLVNLRYGISFVRTWDWRKLLSQVLQITRSGGIVRVTDAEVIHQSNSPALMQLFEMLLCAFFQSGRLFKQESTGLISQLTVLLHQHGYEQIQTRAYKIEYRAGTAEGDAFREDIMSAFRALRPFIGKWGCITKDYGAIYQKAIKEIRQPDFLAVGKILTVWGCRPDSSKK